jgi:hypothetical protein
VFGTKADISQELQDAPLAFGLRWQDPVDGEDLLDRGPHGIGGSGESAAAAVTGSQQARIEGGFARALRPAS